MFGWCVTKFAGVINMQLPAEHILGRLCVAGINHTKAAAEIRGNFSVDQSTKSLILSHASQMGMQSVFVISTCNRTEIYGYAQHPDELAALLTAFTKGTLQELHNKGYQYQGRAALHHLFRVACGLDSQILGDFEIQGQLKQAYTFSLAQNMIGTIMDRTINFVFQASKKIRSTTALSTGTVSVSFAAIEWMQKNLPQKNTEILLIGGGKFGRNVCKNIRQYLPGFNLTICNRTNAIAMQLAESTATKYLMFEQMALALNNYEVIIVCTHAMEHIVKADYFTGNNGRVIIDLSVPANVEEAVANLDNFKLVNVDEISEITQLTLSRRQQEIPKALNIIEEFEKQFFQWLNTYQHASAIRQIKENLKSLSFKNSKRCELATEFLGTITHPIPNVADGNTAPASLQDEQIRKTVNNLMVNLKTKKEKGCQFITAYHHFLSENDTALQQS